MSAAPGLLYITYDGLLEPLGQSQVLAYMRPLAKRFRIHIISFEKSPDRDESAKMRADLEKDGIGWYPLRYHKRPTAAATSYDVATGIAKALHVIRRHGLQLVHARSYVPALIASAVRRINGTPFVFDMRGLWADERVDGKLWARDSALFRITKRFEREFLTQASGIVSLTEAAVSEISGWDYMQGKGDRFRVIPTCVNTERFYAPPTQTIRDEFRMAYVGSVGTWYDFRAVARTYRYLREIRSGALFRVINRGQHELIRRELQQEGIDPQDVEIVAATHETVAARLADVDLGVFYYHPSYSRVACAPTKLAEFLACQIPVLTTGWVGDVGAIVREGRVGVALDSLDEPVIRRGMDEALRLLDDPEIGERCTRVVEQRFSLEKGVAGLEAMYSRVAASHG